jgi:trimethylamine corrinoid protein
MIDEAIAEEAKQILIKANKDRAIEIAKSHLEEGGDPLELMNEAFIPGIKAIGDLFGRGKLFLPELIQAADVMKAVTDLVNEKIDSESGEKQKKGTIVLATVKGDVHDIGKCIVVSLMRANGYTVHDMGRDIPTQNIVEEAVNVNADIIGTSALLSTTMKHQKDLENALKSEGLRERFKTIVGGAPVTPRWAARIGADAYAKDAHDGINKVKELLGR